MKHHYLLFAGNLTMVLAIVCQRLGHDLGIGAMLVITLNLTGACLAWKNS